MPREFVMTWEALHRGSLVLVNPQYGWEQEAGGTPPLSVVGGAGSGVRLAAQPDAADSLERLLAELGGWGEIAAVSGWRSNADQQQIWQETLAESGQEFTRQFVALPGHSEHETGLAIDLGLRLAEIDFIRPEFPFTGVCGRFRERAAAYGFIQRYQAGKEAVCGIAAEPWHFRYVGAPHAEVIEGMGLALEEYVERLRAYPYRQAALPEAMRLGWEVTFCPYAPGKRLALPEGARISGNNVDGFIIAHRLSKRDERP